MIVRMGVKPGNTHTEHMFSALPPKADVAQRGRHVAPSTYSPLCPES